MATLLTTAPNPTSLPLPREFRPERITIENRAGGDIAIDSISLQSIRFSEKKSSRN